MIKVNLVPEEQRKKVREKKFTKPTFRIPKIDMILSVIFLGAVIVIFAGWYLRQKATLKNLDESIATAKQELAALEKERKMVEDLENRQRELKEWVTLVQNLNKGRSLHFHVMDELNKLKPEYMWFIQFDETNLSFELNGKTFSNYMISNFMDKLNASSYFSGVSLKEIRETEEKEHSVIGFQLSGKITHGGEN
jgi:type IV pilus assembly protein PilN